MKDCEECSQIWRSSSVGWTNGLKEIWWRSVEAKCKPCILLGLKHAWARELVKKQSGRQCSLAAKEAHWIILAWMEPSWQGKECFICHLWGYTWVLCPGLASDNPHRLWNTGVSPPEGSHGRKRAEEKLRKLSLFSLQKKGSQGRSSHCLQLTDKRI